MGEDSNNDLEIGSVENFGGSKDEQFSHSSLVMSAMKRCLEAGTKEMREGWFNERTDRQGNQIRTYIEDTRKAFIESVRSLKMVMAGDLDVVAVKRIKKYLASIKEREQEFIKSNNETWDNLSSYEKGLYLKSGQRHFSKVLTHPILKQHLIEYELQQWRKVFAELSRLTKRLGYYKSEPFEV
jgi:hypothetical protein